MSYGNAVKLLRLAIAAAGRVGVSLPDIEKMFECDRRTAQRMTGALSDVFSTTERWEDEERRPRWRLPTQSIMQFLTPSPEELAVLARAIDKLRNDGATNEARTLQGLEEKVLAIIPKHARSRIEVDEEALLQALGLATRPGPRPVIQEEVDGHIAMALKARRVIDIFYQGRKDPKPKWRRISPHGLLLGTRRYLVAQDIQRNDHILRHYRVEDILDVRQTGDNFVPSKDFDITIHARGAFSSYVNDQEIELIVCKFHPAVAEHAKRFLFHPNQTVQEETDGSLVVSFKASGLLEMCWHLYAWGDAVEVIAPVRLREMVEPYRRSDFDSLP